MALTAGARSVRKDNRNRTLAERWQPQSKDNSAMADAAPTTPNRTLPRRQPIAAYRQREYLTESEVERLIGAARKRGRNSSRDAAAILLAYRHGLRAQELCQLRWSQVDLRNGRLHVNRISVHPLHGPELRALRPLQGTVRVRDRSRITSDHCLVLADGSANRQSFPPRSSAHAASFDRI